MKNWDCQGGPSECSPADVLYSECGFPFSSFYGCHRWVLKLSLFSHPEASGELKLSKSLGEFSSHVLLSPHFVILGWVCVCQFSDWALDTGNTWNKNKQDQHYWSKEESLKSCFPGCVYFAETHYLLLAVGVSWDEAFGLSVPVSAKRHRERDDIAYGCGVITW